MKARLIFQKSQAPEASLPVIPSRDTELYKFYKGIDLSAGINLTEDDKTLVPHYDVTQDQLDEMLDYLGTSIRDDIGWEDHAARLMTEILYFERVGAMPFLYNAWQLIQRFKADGVVWGVGRGSSCASYSLYILGIHDINPIKYNIDFSEFSKEYGETGT